MPITPGAVMKTAARANGRAQSATSRCRAGISTTSTPSATATEMTAERDTDAGIASAISPTGAHRRRGAPLRVVDREVDREWQQHPGHDSEFDRVDGGPADPVQAAPGRDSDVDRR